MKVYGWKATELANHLSLAELVTLRASVTDDPKNQRPSGANTIWLYTKSARKKLDAIGWAITYKLVKEPQS
jgi:hypothetical protein